MAFEPVAQPLKGRFLNLRWTFADGVFKNDNACEILAAVEGRCSLNQYFILLHATLATYFKMNKDVDPRL